MFNSVFSRTLKERWKATLIWSLSLFGMGLLFAGIFDTFSGQIGTFSDLYPESIEAFVGDIEAAGTPEGWLNVELYSLFLPLILAIVGVSFGASAIGKEEDSGTLELLLASPVSRAKILLQKAAAIESQILIIALSTWLGIVFGSLVFPFDVSLVNTFWTTIMAALLGLLFAYIALATQATSGKRALAAGVGAAAVAVGYFADVLPKLIDSLDFLKHISPFYYYSSLSSLTEGLNVNNLLVLLLASLFFYAVAHIGFSKRDTGV